MAKVLEKASPVFSAPLKPKSEVETSKLKQRLSQAGFRGDGSASVFLGLKFVGLMVGLFFGGSLIVALSGTSQTSMMYVVIVAATLFYLPDLVVALIGRSRKQQIFLSLPDALDLLVVCVEAGLGLDQAMRKVADEMKRSARRDFRRIQPL